MKACVRLTHAMLWKTVKPLHRYIVFQSMAWVRKFSFIHQQYSKVLVNHIWICFPCPKESHGLPQLATSLSRRMLWSHKAEQNDLNGHKTALNAKTHLTTLLLTWIKDWHPFYAKRLINKLIFLTKTKDVHMYMHACMAGKLVAKKSTI